MDTDNSDVGSLIPVKSLIRYLKSISERSMRSKGLGWRKPYLVCKYCNIRSVNNEILCSGVQVKISHAQEELVICV
jgi:hypothetical protein